MSNNKDGVPAFPVPEDSQSNVVVSMSLRDWFAGMAMQGLLANPARYESMSGQVAYTGRHPEENAERAYMEADAMIKQRSAT